MSPAYYNEKPQGGRTMRVSRTEEDLLLPLKRRIHEVFGVPRSVLGLPEESRAPILDPYYEPPDTFEAALRRLVEGIDVQGEDGTWAVDREALEHARRVLFIHEEEEAR